MRSIAGRVGIPLLLCTALVPAHGASQRPDSMAGAVEGVVFDSTASVPLRGADVYLWGTPHRAVTDSEGGFGLEGVRPGRYTLVFYHPRLGELGVSPGGFEVVVRPGEVARATLTVPSQYTLLAARCALDAADLPGTAGGPLVGRVTDAATGVAYPMARVELSWTRRGGVPSGSRELTTDAGGWYAVCDAPPGVNVAVVAAFLGRMSARQEVVLEPRETARLDLPLANLPSAVLEGRLLDAGTGTPVEGARVTLDGTEYEATTDDGGAFRVEDMWPGSYTLVVRRLPYAPLEESLFVTGGQVTNVVLRLSEEAMAVDPLEVTVERTSLTDRAMGGLVVGREAIERVTPRVRDLADVLREQHVSGLIVRRQGTGACVGFTTGQARMRRSGCVPVTVFIDGARATDPYAVFTIPADAVDRLILYRPIEAGNLFGAGSGNGVLEVYTRW
ncbi:MAG: carboxypeptidase regulatory-like domain-containing protein [Gemmatimonadota bacterium]